MVYSNIYWVYEGFEISVHISGGGRTRPTKLYLVAVVKMECLDIARITC